MRKVLILLIIFLFTPFFITHGLCQAPPPPDPVGIPIDGGLLFLLIGGIIYGGRKFYSKVKDEMNSDK